jgi:hypothetical protein
MMDVATSGPQLRQRLPETLDPDLRLKQEIEESAFLPPSEPIDVNSGKFPVAIQMADGNPISIVIHPVMRRNCRSKNLEEKCNSRTMKVRAYPEITKV